MSATQLLAYEWKELPWKNFEVQLFKLQKRIYRASSRGDVETVHKLQRLLLNSKAAKFLAVRTVTQDNRGKKTAGVDGVKSLKPPARFALVESLNLARMAEPVRRVWIPKPGKAEKRPLGIPVMFDRAAQTLVRFALEPEWEAHFEPNSYGFRPGRSCHDAIMAIYLAVNKQAKYVLDADIAACFDRINHTALLDKLNTFPALRQVIAGWLKAGVMDKAELVPTHEGTPQGGPLSPLLANIALHGLETVVQQAFPIRYKGKRPIAKPPKVIRYADDFVVIHEKLAVVEQAREVIARWLAGIGLELKPSKTRLTHTLTPYEGKIGFDFLGFHIRQFPVGKTHSGQKAGGGKLGFKTIIKPSADAQQRHLNEVGLVIKRHSQVKQEILINHLNPKIRGWANYHSRQVSKQVFGKLDHLTYLKLRSWARRRHPNKSRTWVVKRYWHSQGTRNWVFKGKDEKRLALRADVPIERHVKVKGTASPYDGNLLYWATRLGRHPEISKSKAALLKAQGGRCASCKLLFQTLEELIEIDHVIPRKLGGTELQTNRQLLHGHCHDVKTAKDGSLVNRNRQPLKPGGTQCQEPR